MLTTEFLFQHALLNEIKINEVVFHKNQTKTALIKSQIQQLSLSLAFWFGKTITLHLNGI
jgi:hypothetical protein